MPPWPQESCAPRWRSSAEAILMTPKAQEGHVVRRHGKRSGLRADEGGEDGSEAGRGRHKVRTLEKTTVMTVQVASAQVMASASLSPIGETDPPSVSDTITPTPTMTKKIGTHRRIRPLRGRSTRTAPRSAERRPVSAGCWPRWCRKEPPRSRSRRGKEAATASPGSPMSRNIRTVPRQPSRQSM